MTELGARLAVPRTDAPVGVARRDVTPPTGIRAKNWGPADWPEDRQQALRRPRHDGRTRHAVVVPGEVDVVHAVAVEVATGGHVSDDRVRLPGQPEAARHLHGVGGAVDRDGRGDGRTAEHG
ncbi:hypothetical protein, partial [Leifsonia aquatica]